MMFGVCDKISESKSSTTNSGKKSSETTDKMKDSDFKKYYPNLPKEVLERGKAVRLIFLGIPLLVVTTIELYKRLGRGDTKKVQVGELMLDGSIRPFSEEEIRQKDQNSILTQLFGEDTVDYTTTTKK